MSDTRILAIDQGTTSTRAILFDASGNSHGVAQRDLPQIYPADGWVEHDPEDIWNATVAVCRDALARTGTALDRVAAIGIANQRETTVLWHRGSGRPLHNAIVWQDRRTADHCRALAAAGHGELIRRKTGLVIDAYFSASKIAWLLDNVPGARAAAKAGDVAFGTVDSFLLWRLTGGQVHATDATNASRTMLFDIVRQDWDAELLELFGIPRAILPEVRDCAAAFGTVDAKLLVAGSAAPRSIPITGIAGDQQAATVGQACLEPGMIKSTYGTGCFVVLNTGAAPVDSRNRLLATVACRIGDQPTYALEGSIFSAGSAVQWLRDGLGLIRAARETEALASGLAGTGGVYLVPAFTGLGAPYWDPAARAALVGVTRASGRAEVARAALEAVAYQTRDLLAAMAKDGAAPPTALRVDGGMVENAWLMQFLADICDVLVERPRVVETTAWGAAMLAGLGAGLYSSLADAARHWRAEAAWRPAMARTDRDRLYAGWRAAVARVTP
jgi:glycerol kinase